MGIAWRLRLTGKICTLPEKGAHFKFSLLVKHCGRRRWEAYWLCWASKLSMCLVFEASVLTWVAGSSPEPPCLWVDCHTDPVLGGTSPKVEGLSNQLGAFGGTHNLILLPEWSCWLKNKTKQKHSWYYLSSTNSWTAVSHRSKNKQGDSCFQTWWATPVHSLNEFN